jgi:hypothetical protein
MRPRARLPVTTDKLIGATRLTPRRNVSRSPRSRFLLRIIGMTVAVADGFSAMEIA